MQKGSMLIIGDSYVDVPFTIHSNQMARFKNRFKVADLLIFELYLMTFRLFLSR